MLNVSFNKEKLSAKFNRFASFGQRTSTGTFGLVSGQDKGGLWIAPAPREPVRARWRFPAPPTAAPQVRESPPAADKNALVPVLQSRLIRKLAIIGWAGQSCAQNIRCNRSIICRAMASHNLYQIAKPARCAEPIPSRTQARHKTTQVAIFAENTPVVIKKIALCSGLTGPNVTSCIILNRAMRFGQQ